MHFLRSFATAAAKRSNEKGLPAKQVLMKKQKSNRNSDTVQQLGVNRLAPLTQALFNVDPACVEAANASSSDKSEMKRREIIDAAWSRHENNRRLRMIEWEVGFIKSKCEALNELRKVSEKLYQSAIQLDYSLPPVHRRMATMTPPHPDNFPIKHIK